MISQHQQLFIVFIVFSLPLTARSCATFPSQIYHGNTGFTLYQGLECRGGKVHEIQNVQDVDQCSNACVRYNCVAVNVFNTESGFVCEILGTFLNMVPAQGAACYTAFGIVF